MLFVLFVALDPWSGETLDRSTTINELESVSLCFKGKMFGDYCFPSQSMAGLCQYVSSRLSDEITVQSLRYFAES
jgi:hypothetical protein